MPLQGAYEHDNIEASMGKVSNSTKKGHVELMKLWRTEVLGFGVLKLGMGNGPHVAHIHNLVEGHFLGQFVLYMPYTAIREGVPFNLEFAKDTLNGGKYQDKDLSNTSK